MKNTAIFIALCCILFSSCTTNSKNKETSFISIDIKDVGKTVSVPLSDLIETLEVIPLENKDEAICKIGVIYVSDNYIGIRPFSQDPYKLFNRKGKFIANIGARGQGPGEYGALYHSQIDEKKQRIYLTSFNADKILAYDLKGKYFEKEDIKFPNRIRKAIPYVDNKKKTVTVFTLPFKGMDKYVCWVQNSKGKFIQKVKAGRFALKPDFSNEVVSSNNTANYDFMLGQFIQKQQDTLYHYNVKDNQLIPVFTLKAPRKPGKLIYDYLETPNNFYAFVKNIDRKQTQHSDSDIGKTKAIMVDKKTKQTHFVRIVNDFLGDLDIDPYYLSFQVRNGYLTFYMEPVELKEMLEVALKKGNLKPEIRKRLEQLKVSFKDNDNNVLFIGKLKDVH